MAMPKAGGRANVRLSGLNSDDSLHDWNNIYALWVQSKPSDFGLPHHRIGSLVTASKPSDYGVSINRGLAQTISLRRDYPTLESYSTFEFYMYIVHLCWKKRKVIFTNAYEFLNSWHPKIYWTASRCLFVLII